jgi:hypothetical protein
MSFSFTAPPKDPQASLDYDMDWTGWLAAGETIAAQSVSSNDAVLVVTGVALTGNKVRWRLSGGVAGQNYLVTVAITTSTGQADNRTVQIRVRER